MGKGVRKMSHPHQHQHRTWRGILSPLSTLITIPESGGPQVDPGVFLHPGSTWGPLAEVSYQKTAAQLPLVSWAARPGRGWSSERPLVTCRSCSKRISPSSFPDSSSHALHPSPKRVFASLYDARIRFGQTPIQTGRLLAQSSRCSLSADAPLQ